MDTPLECYAMVDQGEREAAEVHNMRAREILLSAATSWRKLGDAIEKVEALSLGEA